MYRDLSSFSTAELQGELAARTLLFRPLFPAGRAYAFRCDAQGHVDLDTLSERARNNYFYARAMVGRELTYPTVQEPQ